MIKVPNNSRILHLFTLSFCLSLLSSSNIIASPLKDYNNAIQEASQKNYSKAIDLLKKEIAVDSAFTEAYLRLADFFSYRKTSPEGIAFFQKSIGQQPENPNLYIGLAQLFKHDQEWENVFLNCKTALAKGSNLAYLVDLTVESALQTKKTNELARILGKIKKDPARQQLYDLGYASWRNRINSIKKARSSIMSYLKENEDFFGYKVLGDIERNAENFERSTQSYLTALKMNRGEQQNICVDILKSIAGNFREIEDPESAHSYFTNALALARKTASRREQLEVSKSTVSLYKQLGFFQKMADACEDGIQVAKELEQIKIVANLTHDLAFAYEKMADARRALKQYQLTSQVLEKDPDSKLQSKTYSAIGRIYRVLNDHELALKYLEDGAELARRTGEPKLQHSALLEKGNVYALLGETQKAKTVYKRVLRYAQRTQQHNLTETCFMKLANLFLLSKEPDLNSAKYYFTLANALARQTFQLQFAAGHRWMQGKIALMEDDIEKAETFFQEAIQLGKECGSYLSLIAGQSGLVRTYLAANILDLAAAYSDSVLNSLTHFLEYSTEEDNFEFFDLRKDTFLPAVSAFSRVGDLEKIYRVTEQYKATKYNLALSAAKFKSRAAMVDSIRWRVDVKNKQISEKWQAQWQSWQKERNDHLELIMKHRKEIDELAKKKEWELARIRQKYPDAYQNFNPRAESLTALQAKLQKLNTTFVHYLVGEDATFITVVKPDSILCKRINRGADFLDSLLTKISPLVTTNSAKQSSIATEANSFQLKVSGEVYELIFGPIRSWLPKGGSVVISRDGVLSRLPFESLVTNKDELSDDHDFNTAKFLVEDFIISYVPFAKLLDLPTRQKKEAKRIFLAFANSTDLPHNIPPSQWSSNGNLYPDEGYLKAISKPFGSPETRAYWGEAATKDRFLEEVPNFQIIHMHLPSFTDERSPVYSKIYFSPTRERESYIESHDLFNLTLSADLAILTGRERAVETLNGSAGREYLPAFNFASVPSLVKTSWNVGHNPKLIEDFYLHLKLGLSKAEALQQAKVAYLKDVGRNPFEWAPYILEGNPGRIVFKSNSKYWIIYITLLGVAIFITMVVWQILKIKSSSREEGVGPSTGSG